jgi:hypothetical protein
VGFPIKTFVDRTDEEKSRRAAATSGLMRRARFRR